jgi:MFS family permease
MSSTSDHLSGRDPTQGRLLLLASVLFVSYLCVAIPLPVIPVYVTGQLGLGNGWAGLAVGIAFLSTILTRGHAGALSDRLGAKVTTTRGLVFYAVGALFSLSAGLSILPSGLALAVLMVGRLLVGYGESLVGVGVIAWGIGIAGPDRSGRVIALIGAAIYGALAVGGPLGLLMLDHNGFVAAMATSVALPCIGLLAMGWLEGIAPHPETRRSSFRSVMGRIWMHGLIVFLQGIGFAGIGAFFALYFLDRGWAYAGLGLTAFGSGFVLVRLCAGHLPDRIGGFRVAIASLAIEAVGQFVIWSAPSPAAALVGAFLTGLGCSLIYPAMGREVVKLVDPHLRGTAVGGFGAFQDLAYGLTGPIAGLLADQAGYGSVFLIGGIAATMGFLTTLILQRRSQIGERIPTDNPTARTKAFRCRKSTQ